MFRPHRMFLPVFLFWFVCPNLNLAQNWPSFRGPNGSGIGTGNPPIRWNVETGANIKWKTPIQGMAPLFADRLGRSRFRHHHRQQSSGFARAQNRLAQRHRGIRCR